jgi:hypothetical protein
MSRFTGSTAPSVKAMLEERVSQGQVVGVFRVGSDDVRSMLLIGEQLPHSLQLSQKLVLG